MTAVPSPSGGPVRRLLAATALAALTLAACGSDDDDGGPTMLPGSNCLSCHSGSGEAPAFTAAGTVYGAGNAAADAGLQGAAVTLTGSGNGQVVTLTTNSAGNFFTSQPLTAPISVLVARGGQTATMSRATGACGSCHAPGTGVHPTRVHVGTCAVCHP
jgi:hypothetical protein